MPTELRRCYICKRELTLDAFLTITVSDKRCKPGHSWTGPSSDCRECRNKEKREARARAKGFPTWEAWQQEKREEKKRSADQAATRSRERADARAAERAGRSVAARVAARELLEASELRPRKKKVARERSTPRLIAIPDLRPREIERFHSKHEVGEGCWEWTGQLSTGGYGYFTVSRDGGTIDLVSSRVAWTITNGPIPDGLFVLHRCDNRPCVNPAHLFVGTHDDNMADMVAKGRSAPLNSNATSARNRRKSKCPQCGSQFVESPHESQRTKQGKGRRRCPRCKAAWQATYKKVWKARRLVG